MITQKLEEFFVALWCLSMPIFGTLLIPKVQGTIPAYLLAFGSVFFVMLRVQRGEIPPALKGYLKSLLSIVLLWLVLLAASQLEIIISGRHDFAGVDLIDRDDRTQVMRPTLFTQSLYFLACVLIALYFRYFFQASWIRYVLYGAYFMAAYGIYEWIYFIVFHQPGDFLANRTFGEEQHPGSWSQTVTIGPFHLLRIKSTSAEPAVFAASLLPYLFLALDYRKVILSLMLIFTAIFSTSTACYVGLLLCLIIRFVWTGRFKASQLALLLVVAVAIAVLGLIYRDAFDAMFTKKFAGDDNSGQMRINSMMATVHLLQTFNPVDWLVGIGFGYVYAVIVSELLLDTGLIGLGVFLYVILRPLIQLPLQAGSEGLKWGMLALVFFFSITLPELFMPTSWMFIGLAYWKLDGCRQSQRTAWSPIRVAEPELSSV